MLTLFDTKIAFQLLKTRRNHSYLFLNAYNEKRGYSQTMKLVFTKLKCWNIAVFS